MLPIEQSHVYSIWFNPRCYVRPLVIVVQYCFPVCPLSHFPWLQHAKDSWAREISFLCMKLSQCTKLLRPLAVENQMLRPSTWKFAACFPVQPRHLQACKKARHLQAHKKARHLQAHKKARHLQAHKKAVFTALGWLQALSREGRSTKSNEICLCEVPDVWYFLNCSIKVLFCSYFSK